MITVSEKVTKMRNVNRALKKHLFIRQEIDRRIQPRIAATIWDRAHIDLERIYSIYRNVPKKVSTHTDSVIFPTVAIYRALKKYAPEEAYGIMKEAMAKKTSKSCKCIAKMSAIPIFTHIYLILRGPVQHITFKNTSPADTVHCPYHKYPKELRCSELITLFCDNE